MKTPDVSPGVCGLHHSDLLFWKRTRLTRTITGSVFAGGIKKDEI
jgi:hypothetical protein